ncbi:MAG: hypothetical protein AAF363_14970 [Bacteroidota bacterium]
MPANKRYLTTSFWAKFGKITAAIIGGLVTSTAFHLALASQFNTMIVWGTAIFTTFLLWAGIILFVYWIRVAWKAWLFCTIVTMASAAIIYLSNTVNS